MKRTILAVAVLMLSAVAVVPLHGALADGDDRAPYPFDTYKPATSDNAVLQWNDEALECIRATKPGPTVVARALFILSAPGFDAWAAYDRKAVPTVRTGFSRRPASQRTAANKAAAVSYAAHRTLSDLARNNPFQPCRADFDARLTEMGLSLAEAVATSPTTTAGQDGKRTADNILAARRNDGANQAGNYADTTGYRPVNTPDAVTHPWRWQPVRVPIGDPNGVPQTPLTPHWGRVKPFDANLPGQAIQVPDPFKLSTAERTRMIDEIIRESAGLDDRKKVIAEYWADGPQSELPPGHWNLIAGWVSRRWKQSIDADAKMFLTLNGAMLDASIAAWQHKYRYDFARPVSVMNRASPRRATSSSPGPASPAPRTRPASPAATAASTGPLTTYRRGT